LLRVDQNFKILVFELYFLRTHPKEGKGRISVPLLQMNWRSWDIKGSLEYIILSVFDVCSS
jgi:hypothetical protein